MTPGTPHFDILDVKDNGLNLNILMTPKCILWQRVKTQMKCRIYNNAAFLPGLHCLLKEIQFLFGNYNM